jgi:hypothetical protein
MSDQKEVPEVKFTVEQVNAILAQLGRMPYEQVAGLIQAIQQIAAPQVQADPPPAPEQAAE